MWGCSFPSRRPRTGCPLTALGAYKPVGRPWLLLTLATVEPSQLSRHLYACCRNGRVHSCYLLVMAGSSAVEKRMSSLACLLPLGYSIDNSPKASKSRQPRGLRHVVTLLVISEPRGLPTLCPGAGLGTVGSTATIASHLHGEFRRKNGAVQEVLPSQAAKSCPVPFAGRQDLGAHGAQHR